MNIYDVLKLYNQDIVILEGTRNAVVPEIVVCGEDKFPELTPLTIAVSGKYSNTHSGDYEGLPIINAVTDVKRLADLILEKTPPLMYDILKGKRSYSECVLNNREITLSVDGSDVPMVPFVQNLLKNVTLGVVSELKGYSKNAEIIIRIKQNG
jgi:molybdopterin-guanine dinucleotide biosynthesis protein B